MAEQQGLVFLDEVRRGIGHWYAEQHANEGDFSDRTPQSKTEMAAEGAMTVIAMTREIGSHGSEVAAGVAAELGLEIINSEIVVPHIAGSLGLEHSSVQRYVDGKATLFDRWQIDTRKLSQYTLDHILNLSLKGNVLIRGWGAAALFQGIHGVICVRVCAPMALRVRVMMERLGVKDADAIQQEIERFDAGHSHAMRAAFNFDWNDALLYHIVLNSARVTVDNCVKTICQLTEHENSQDDSTTKAALAEKLREIKAGEIAARTDDM